MGGGGGRRREVKQPFSFHRNVVTPAILLTSPSLTLSVFQKQKKKHQLLSNIALRILRTKKLGEQPENRVRKMLPFF